MLALMGRPNLGTHGFSVARRWTVTSASSASVLPGLTDLAPSTSPGSRSTTSTRSVGRSRPSSTEMRWLWATEQKQTSTPSGSA